MKRITFLFFAMLLSALSWQGTAQVPIGTQDGTSSNMPIHGLYNYSYSQQLVYQSEINASGNITSISFYYVSGTPANNDNWSIYMGHTSKTSFSNNNDWVAGVNLDPVFSGTVSFPSGGNMMLITFDTPFPYNGTDNLVVAVTENKPGWSSTSFGKTTTVADSNRGIYWSDDGITPDLNNPPAAKERFGYINNMILGGIQVSCPAPDQLAVTNVTQTSATLGWNENGSATAWEVVYGARGFNPQATGTTVSVSANPSTTLSGLASSSDYDFYVKAVCGANDHSALVGPTSFATACAPTSVPYLLDFENATVPNLPNCTSRETLGIGKDWRTSASATGFTGKVLNYPYHASTPVGRANSWFYTAGVQLEAGVNYDISYKYGNNSTFYTESMKVAYGTSPDQAAMTNQLADYPEIQLPSGAPADELITFTVPANGVYYFGFNAYSIQNQNQLYVDDIGIVFSPSCPVPSDLAASSITGDSAHISWTESATAAQWEVIYGEANFDPLTEGDTVTAHNNPEVTLSNLMANTPYQFYVKAICDVNDESTLAGPVSFRTACDLISSLPYTENFDTYGTGATAFPACWERPVTYISGTNIWPSIVAGNATSTPNSLRFQALTDTPTYAVSPPFAEDINNLRVSFMLKREGTSSGTIDVGVMSDASDISTFELVQTIDPADNNYHEYSFNLNQTTLSGSGNFIALRHNSNSSAWFYWVDDFEVDLVPSCIEPSALTASDITATTADVSWTLGDSETAWNISWGAPGYTPHDENQIGMDEITTTSYQITNLMANTNYHFYVQADCGGDFSSWAGPLSFKTACGAVTEMFENFDSYATGSIVPDCWARMVPATSAGSQTITSTSPASGTRNIWQNTSTSQNAVIVALPEFSNINAGTHWLRLKARAGSATGLLLVGYVTDVSDYDSFTLIESLSITNTSYTSDSDYTVAVPTSVPAGARIGIKSANNGTAIYWDDVYWEIAPSCLPPTGLATTAVASTSVDVAWTAAANETAWNVSWGTPGYTPGDGDQIDTATSNTANYQIAGLTASTLYDVYVQSDCGGNDVSTWAGPLSVFTGYCIPSSTYTGDYLSGINSDGAITNISYGTSSIPAGGYGDETQQDFMSHENQTFNINTTYVGGANGVNIWVDWNNDMIFDANELMASVAGSAASKTLTITVPSGMAQGDYRMRVRGEYGSTANPSACGDISFGSAVDFTLTIVAPPTCPGPTDLAVGTITENSANLSWTPGGTETTWDIEYGPRNFDLGEGEMVYGVTTNNPYVLTGLDGSLQYDVYVRASCGLNDESAWVGPVSFSTPCSTIVAPWSEDFEGGTNGNILINDLSCWSQEYVTGTSDWKLVSANGDGSISPHSGALMAEFRNTSAGTATKLISPVLDLTALNVPELTFYYANVNWFGDIDELRVYYKKSVSDANWTLIPGAEYTDEKASWEEVKLNLPETNGATDYVIAFEGTSDYARGLNLDDVSVNEAQSAGYVYQNGTWTPSDPSGVATSSDDITVINGSTSLTANTDVNNLTIMQGATLNIDNVLNLYGDLTISGDLVFVSNANGNGELGVVSGTSTISGDATVQRYMKAKRSYRMVSSAVTTSNSVHANWQEGAASNTHNPNPGFGTHITGSTTDQQNGFDGTGTGNPSMFTVDVAAQAFVAVSNTNVNTLNAGTPYLLFVRGDRSTDLTNDLAAGETVLRAKGALRTGSAQQPFATVAAGAFAMFGNPYQSAVNVNSVFANSTNVNAGHYYVYDPSLGNHGSYVTVALPAGTNTAASAANQFLQPGQGAQFATAGIGASSILFNEADKAPGNFTTTSANDNRLSSDNMLTVQLFTVENFNNGGPTHDSFGIIFGDGLDNGITNADAVKPMNFYENLGRDHTGTYLSLERREMPQPAEVYPLYSSGYGHSDYALKMSIDGLEDTFLYLDDHFTGTSTLIEGETVYAFGIDANNDLSIATDRFSIRTEQRLGVDNNGLLSGVRLFPNPLSNNTFYINAPKLNGKQIAVSISDLSGRQVFENMLDCRANTVTVSVNDNLASGVYMVTLKHGGEEHTFRLVKK